MTRRCASRTGVARCRLLWKFAAFPGPKIVRGHEDPGLSLGAPEGGRHNGSMDARPSRRLLARLLAGTVVPTVGAPVVFGFFAPQLARRAQVRECPRTPDTTESAWAASVYPA